MRDIVDILGDLNGALDGLGTAERSGVLEGIFGKIPIAGVNVLLASGSDRLREYRKELKGASGASSTMASVIRDTLQGRLNSLKSAVEGVKISIFSMTSGPLADAIDKTTEWVRANEQLIATNVGEFLANIINNFENIVKWAKRIGIALAVFFTLATILKTLILIMTVVNLVMAANPITLAIMALIAAVASAIFWWDELKAAFLGFSGPVKAAFATLAGPIGWIIGAASLIMDSWGHIKTFFADLWGGVVDIFNTSVDTILGVVDEVRGAATFIGDVASSAGSSVAGFFGFEDDEEGQGVGATGPQVVSPQERVARTIDEQRTTQTAEVTIRDESGRAEVTVGTLGAGLKLQNSGAF